MFPCIVIHWFDWARLGVFLAVALVLGLLAVPRLLAYVARFKSNEVLLVTVLGLLLLVLNATVLPPWNILLVLLLVVAAVTGLLWHGLIKIYSMGQVALQETFATEPPPRPSETPASHRAADNGVAQLVIDGRHESSARFAHGFEPIHGSQATPPVNPCTP